MIEGYDSQVFDEVRIAVFQRCEELVAQRPPAELAGLGLKVEVSTAWSLAEPERIRSWIRHAIGGDLPGVRLDDVLLTLRPEVPAVAVQFVVDGRSQPAPPEPDVAPPLRLDLIYD